MQSGQSATCPAMWALQGHSLRCLGSEPAQLKSSGSCWRLQCRPQGLYEGNRWFTPCSIPEQPIPSLKDRKVVIIYYFSCRLWYIYKKKNNPRPKTLMNDFPLCTLARSTHHLWFCWFLTWRMQQDCWGGETEQVHKRGRSGDTHLHRTAPEGPGGASEHFVVAKQGRIYCKNSEKIQEKTEDWYKYTLLSVQKVTGQRQWEQSR